DVHGIIVQLPINGWPDPQLLLDLIPSSKDVDGLSMASLQALKDKSARMVPATPLAILRVLELSDISLSNKKIVIVGQGKLVGLPLNIILRNRGLDVIVADISTEDLATTTKQADVLITATGQPK